MFAYPLFHPISVGTQLEDILERPGFIRCCHQENRQTLVVLAYLYEEECTSCLVGSLRGFVLARETEVQDEKVRGKAKNHLRKLRQFIFNRSFSWFYINRIFNSKTAAILRTIKQSLEGLGPSLIGLIVNITNRRGALPAQIGRAHAGTPPTPTTRRPSSHLK